MENETISLLVKLKNVHQLTDFIKRINSLQLNQGKKKQKK